MQVKIPEFYLTLANKNKQAFVRYVEQYIKVNHPGYELQTIKQMTAVINKGE